MKNLFKKISGKRGFTLTEVLVGISILTVAIVSATNLLVTIVQSNKNNVKTLQAYYYAQEGIEAFRNIRDTNWLHNQNWLNGTINDKIWGSGFGVPNDPEKDATGNMYEIKSKNVFSRNGDGKEGINQMNGYAPWEVSLLTNASRAISNEDGLKRVIYVYPYECEKGKSGANCSDYARVVSRVFWTDGGSEKEVKLNEIFTNWKGGAL
ncbi:MAG: type II secretion system protein [Candidatus Peregrinibacteria bacterium]|nr:type II secretion system protein [Candidatus Peregrinibacteria bacterium]